jgi:hypothetical protein
MMTDRSYEDGVTAESVCDMVDDMYRCLSGTSTYIKMPMPLVKTGASIYMNFVDNNDTYVSDLSPRRKKTTGSSRVRTSVVSRARFTLSVKPGQSMENIDPECEGTVRALNEMIRDISVHDSASDRSPNDIESIHSRTVMSDTSADDQDGYATDNNRSMEDLDSNGMPMHLPQRFSREKPVLRRVESIVHTVDNNRENMIVGGPAGRFGRRM